MKNVSLCKSFYYFYYFKIQKKNINKGRQESKEFLINIQMAFA